MSPAFRFACLPFSTGELNLDDWWWWGFVCFKIFPGSIGYISVHAFKENSFVYPMKTLKKMS